MSFTVDAKMPQLGSYEPDHADFFSLILIEKGTAHFTINGTDQKLGAGTLLVVSPRVLMCLRTVKERAQTTVKALILNLLFKDACTLLRHGNMPITAVSEALGFADLETFSKFFKRYAGMAPSKYISIHNS